MRILCRQKKVEFKPSRGHRPVSASADGSLSAFGGSLLALEPRIMFDGAAVTTASTVTTEQVSQQQADAAASPDEATTADPTPEAPAPTGEPQFAASDKALFDALAAYDQSTARHEVVFVSSSVAEYQHLLDGISSNVEVVVLDPTRDGVTQMAEALAGRTGIDAIHLIGEGTNAELHLGSSFLTQDSLCTQYAALFQQIGQSLSTDADVLIYGCNFGRGEAGQLAMNTLATLTGADVAASTDRIGSAAEYGNWQLEVSTGSIETAVVIGASTQATWDHALATFTVTTTSDSGAASLRDAITKANAAVGSDTIVFNITGAGVHTINLASALPTITDTVILDATTQSGYVAGSPVIILDGSGAGANANGFVLRASNSTITGFQIQGFVNGSSSITGTGILLDGTTGGGDNNTISFNYLTNNSESVTGAVGAISITGAADDNLITNNQLINNNSDGIRFANALGTGNQITNNTISGSGDDGVKLVGADITFSGNTVANSQRLTGGAAGVELESVTGSSVISGNTITNDGTHGNEGGVWIKLSSAVTVSNNTISGWSGSGIAVEDTSSGILFSQNAISNNGRLGIDLFPTAPQTDPANGVTPNDAGDGDAGANDLKNTPILTSAVVNTASSVTVTGTYNSLALVRTHRIEFFASSTGDPSGSGEAQRYLGFTDVTTDGGGNTSFNVTLSASIAAGEVISATATDLTLVETSELSANVTATNTAPALDTTKSPVLSTIAEDAGVPAGAVGTLVSQLIDFASPTGQVDNVTDPDTGALLGIAITAADTTNGTWFYSTDGGGNWMAVGAVGNASARLLAADANTRLYFQPNADYNGTIANAITFRAWDQTSGANGGTADTTTNGGSTAFSTATDTASLIINPVNDAPVAVNDAYSVNEDTTLVVGPPTTSLANYWNFNDGGTSQTPVDSGSLGNNGTLGSTAGVDANDPAWTGGYVGTNALSFDGTTDYVSTNSTIAKTASNFTLSAWFQTDTTTGSHHILWEGYPGGNGYGNGGSTSPATSEMSLSVGGYNASYDNKVVFSLGYDVPPATANSIFIASASNFTDTAGWHHVAVTVSDVGGGVMSASLYVDGQLEGTDTGSENDRSVWNSLLIGGTSSGTRLFDGKMDEVRIYDTALSGAQVQNIAQAGVLQNDSDVDSRLIKVNTSVVTGPANGSLSINSDGSFTYTPNVNFSGIDSFTYKANDGTVDSNVATVTITVNPVNDAPVLDNTKSPTLTSENEDSGAPSGAVGTLVSSLVDFASPAGQVDNVTEVDSGAVLGIAITAADSTNGTWFYSTNGGTNWNVLGAVANNGALLLAADANTRLYFQPNADYNGTIASAITFRAWDQTSGSNGTLADTSSNGGTTAFSTATDTASLTVNPVNDAPVVDLNAGGAGQDVTTAFTEQMPVVIAPSGTLSDVDSATLTALTVTLTARPDGDAVESLSLNAAATTAASGAGLTVSYTAGTGVLSIMGPASTAVYQTILQGIQYNNTSDTPTTTNRAITVVANDGTTPSTTQTATLTLTAVNDDPTNSASLPTDVTVTEDVLSNMDLSLINLSDVDTGVGSLTVTLTTGTGGNLTASSGGGITVGGSGTGVLTLTGTQANLNTYLNNAANVQYLHGTANTNGNNTDTITIQVTDNGNTGSGGGGTITLGTVNVDITAQNDAPTITAIADQTIPEDGTTGALAFTVSDVETAAGSLTVTAVSSNTTLIPNGNLTLVNLGGGNWTIAAVPAANQNGGPVTITVTVSDGTTTTNETFDVTVTAQNDPPVLAANSGSTVARGGTDTITNAELQVTDVDNTPAQLTYTVTVAPVNGQLELTTAAGVAITTFTQGQIDAGQVVYLHNGSLTTSDSFTFTVSDGAGGNIGATTFGITVMSVNSAPTLVVNAGSTVVQGLTDVITAGELQVVDLDNTPAQLVYTVTTAPINGRLELTTAPGVAITNFTQADIDAGRLVFVHSGAAATSDNFTFTVSDGAGGTIGATMFKVTVSPFFPPPGGGGSGSGGGGGSTGGSGGSGSGPGSGSGTGSGPGANSTVVPPPIQPPPALIGAGVPGKELSVVGATNDPLPRAVIANRTVARIEHPTVGIQEPPAQPAELFSVPVKKVLAVGHKLVERLTKLADDLERGVQEREQQTHLLGRVASFSGMALSAGFVAWILRGSSLLASFLVSMPAWRHFDPLPVLGIGETDRRKRDRKIREEDEQENRQFRGLDRVLKSSNSGQDRKRRDA